jgi:hypothetical protein
MSGHLACFPTRIEWEMATGWKPEVVAYPTPLVTSRTSLAVSAPAPVAGLEALAVSHGWDTLVTHSEGWEPHATHGRPGERPKVKWSVRMRRGQQYAVAVRTEGSWTSLWTWSTTQFFKRYSTLEAFKEAIR